LLVPASRGVLRGAARGLLDATEELALAFRKESRFEHDDAASVLWEAGARDAGSGWPARLSTDWLKDVFRGEPRELTLELGPLPRPVGAASFARALTQFGFAVRVVMAPSSEPFALAREPAFVAAHRLGFLFGSLVADPEFHVRALGLSRGAARTQARSLVKTAVTEVRTIAVRVLLGDEAAFAPEDLYLEMTVRLFGSPLDERLRGAWPGPREDEPARLLGVLQTAALRRALRDRFDVDWFHNPRAWAHLRDQANGPAREPVDEPLVRDAAIALARELEGAAG
jgi:hypothetical protein